MEGFLELLRDLGGVLGLLVLGFSWLPLAASWWPNFRAGLLCGFCGVSWAFGLRSDFLSFTAAMLRVALMSRFLMLAYRRSEDAT